MNKTYGHLFFYKKIFYVFIMVYPCIVHFTMQCFESGSTSENVDQDPVIINYKKKKKHCYVMSIIPFTAKN